MSTRPDDIYEEYGAMTTDYSQLMTPVVDIHVRTDDPDVMRRASRYLRQAAHWTESVSDTKKEATTDS